METKQAVPAVLLPILSDETKAVANAEQVVVSFSRKKVAASDAFRAVLVPSYTLPSATYYDAEKQEVSDAEEVFSAAISDVFMDAAASIFRKYCDENPKAVTIAAELLSFSAVVEEMQAQQTSQRLTSDAIKAWYESSKTKVDATTRYAGTEKAADKEKGLQEKYLSLASNNPAILPSLAVKMLAYLSTDDTNHAICKALAKRLAKLSKADTADDL